MMSTALDEDLSEVCRLLRERAGLLPESLGMQGIAHTVHRRMSASGTDSLQTISGVSCRTRVEFQELLEDLVVPETWFFRDALAFSCLAKSLDAWRLSGSGVMRVLSVACSTGEEVYSLAMALREAGLASSQFHILGTDLSQRSLELARGGSFSSRSFREQSEAAGALRDRWCEQVGESWRVRDELRAGVEFKWGNLAQSDFLAGESPFHVVFCRNRPHLLPHRGPRRGGQSLAATSEPGWTLVRGAGRSSHRQRGRLPQSRQRMYIRLPAPRQSRPRRPRAADGSKAATGEVPAGSRGPLCLAGARCSACRYGDEVA